MMDSNTVTTTDPFAPISCDEEAGAGPALLTEADIGEVWEPIMPPPHEPPDTAHVRWRNGLLASASWTYRNENGAPLFLVMRFDMPNGDKDVVPYTCCRLVQFMEDGTRHECIEWRFKAPPAPTPLYGLDRLAARPDAPVVFVEGEKAADAAALLFPDHVAVTSQGGAKSAHKADLSPLVGRTVTIFPDNDPAGATYAKDMATLLQDVGAAFVAVVNVPTEWPDGWDVADPHPDGFIDADASRMLAGLLDDAPPAAAEVILPDGYRFTRDGLFYFPDATESNDEPLRQFKRPRSRSLARPGTVPETTGAW